jgi:hypothetical protein
LASLEPREASFEIGEFDLGAITGSMPPAILASESRMLRIDAPNEPMIRYCCWNNCIRLKVTALAPQRPEPKSSAA